MDFEWLEQMFRSKCFLEGGVKSLVQAAHTLLDHLINFVTTLVVVIKKSIFNITTRETASPSSTLSFIMRECKIYLHCVFYYLLKVLSYYIQLLQYTLSNVVTIQLITNGYCNN